MRLLALDTATEACSVALLTDDGVFGIFKEVGRGHAEQILGMVDSVLAEAGIPLGMLDGMAAGVGPGAFTGVRISVSVAQGLAFGAGLPVVAVTTLEALALQALSGDAGQAMACLDARMGEVYWACFSADPT
ncbi:MAG: glycoprotease, partial [Gammaproteobacteria bacterium]|nr:glycoprotease [Gammaproteobacteria bacterium]